VQLLDTAGRAVLWVRISNEDSDHVAAIGGGAAATRASCRAVTAPAETPSTVAVARIVRATSGFWPSTTATTTVNLAPRSISASWRLFTVTCSFLEPREGVGSAAQAARSMAVVFTSCWGPTISTVGIPSDAAKTAS